MSNSETANNADLYTAMNENREPVMPFRTMSLEEILEHDIESISETGQYDLCVENGRKGVRVLGVLSGGLLFAEDVRKGYINRNSLYGRVISNGLEEIPYTDQDLIHDMANLVNTGALPKRVYDVYNDYSLIRYLCALYILGHHKIFDVSSYNNVSGEKERRDILQDKYSEFYSVHPYKIIDSFGKTCSRLLKSYGQESGTRIKGFEQFSKEEREAYIISLMWYKTIGRKQERRLIESVFNVTNERLEEILASPRKVKRKSEGVKLPLDESEVKVFKYLAWMFWNYPKLDSQFKRKEKGGSGQYITKQRGMSVSTSKRRVEKRKVPKPELLEAINNSDVLSDVETDVINKRYGVKDGKMMTHGEIASKYGVTRQRIQQREATILRKLGFGINTDGVFCRLK